MFDGFVNPGLAIGATLAAVPLLIHLLNRQRHKPMPWAAMQFVLAAYRKTRRRARMENLILLLLRMAAVALLAFCVSRPFIGPRSPLAGLTESRRDLVLAIDGSASAGYRGEVSTVFERSIERAREVLLQLDGARGDRVRLVLAGAHPRLLSWRSPDEALSLLGTLSFPTDEPLDLVALVSEIAGYAEEDAAGTGESALEVRLLTDLQRRSFNPGWDEGVVAGSDPTHTPLLSEQLDRVSELGVRILVEDLGPLESTPANLAVAAVEPLGTVLGPGTPTDVRVTVRNFGPNVRSGVRVVLEVDGERRPNRLLEIPARGEASAVFPVVFRSGGAHVLTAHVEADRLPIDDERSEVVLVPPPARVLLVNGEPKMELEDDEVGYLHAVLEPPLGDDPGTSGWTSPFEPRMIERHELRSGAVDLADYDVIVIANVSSLAAETVERLEQRVAAGASLLVTVGEEVDIGSWNQRLFRADGSGLLPAELGGKVAIADRRTRHYRVNTFDEDHPALAFFADERWRPLLTEVPVYEFLTARPLATQDPVAEDETEAEDPDDEPRPRGIARVLARLDDGEQSPLLIERDYDRGKVFLWLTTIDRAWTRLPESPRTLVPLVHELVRYAASPDQPARNTPIGGQLVAEVTNFPKSVSVVRPDGTRRSLDGDPEAVGPLAWRLPVVADTERAGLYRIEIEGAGTIPFAVRIEPGEGDLDSLSHGELDTLHPALISVDAGGDVLEGDDDASRKGELWRLLAALVLAALVAETLWAAWLGWKRRIP
jgi:hypothetical protein